MTNKSNIYSTYKYKFIKIKKFIVVKTFSIRCDCRDNTKSYVALFPLWSLKTVVGYIDIKQQET